MNITAPRITSASTLSSVCETSVPSTTGSRSRARPSRRETISAREGSPRRAGSVADISTPIEVPCIASAKRGSASGSAALRIACQETARRTIEAHIIPSATSTQVGLEASSAWPIGRRPIRSSASSVPPTAASAARASNPRRAIRSAGREALSTGGSSDGIRRGGTRCAVGGQGSHAHGRAGERARGTLDRASRPRRPRSPRRRPAATRSARRCGPPRCPSARSARDRARGRAASRPAGWRRRGARAARRGRRSPRRGSPRCRTRRPACRRRTPP